MILKFGVLQDTVAALKNQNRTRKESKVVYYTYTIPLGAAQRPARTVATPMIKNHVRKLF